MKKQIYITLLVACAMLSGCSMSIKNSSKKKATPSVAETVAETSALDPKSTYTDNNFTYVMSDDGHVCITGYTGVESSVTFPAKIGGYDVYRIGSIPVDSTDTSKTEYVAGIDNVLHISFEEGIKEIGSYAFNGCEWLTGDLVIPDSVTAIGTQAFYNCKRFNSVKFGSGLLTIGDKAFKANISDYQKIKSDEFMGFSGTLDLPKQLTSIGKDAFRGCGNFTGDLIIPDSVTKIGEQAFYNCVGFTGLYVGTGLSEIPDNCFYNNTGMTNLLAVGRNLKKIGKSAFKNCNFTSVSINKPINSITGAPWDFSGSVTWKSEDIVLPDSEVLFKGIASDVQKIYGKDGLNSISKKDFESLINIDESNYDSFYAEITRKDQGNGESTESSSAEEAELTTAAAEGTSAAPSETSGAANESAQSTESADGSVYVPDVFIALKTKSVASAASVLSRYKSSILLDKTLSSEDKIKAENSQIVAYGDYVFYIMLASPSEEDIAKLNKDGKNINDNDLKKINDNVKIGNQSYVSVISEYFN